MNSFLLSLISLRTIGLLISTPLISVNYTIAHRGSTVTSRLYSLFIIHLIGLLTIWNNSNLLWLNVLLITFRTSCFGTKSLWSRPIHKNCICDLLLLIILWILIVTHDTTSENTLSYWLSYLCLISLMISHTILRAHIHIRVSTLWSHTMEHYLTLFISPSFII